jgi:hypothetical protein
VRWLLLLALAACDMGERPDPGPTPLQLQTLASPGDAATASSTTAADPAIDAGIEQPSPRPAVAQNDLDSVARAVLLRYLRDPATTPDGALMQKYPQSAIFVASDIDAGRTLTSAALPSKKLALKTMAELHAEADRTQANAYYIMITGVDISGSEAHVWVGVDFVKPTGKRGHGLCCCVADQLFVRRGKAWRYKSTGMQECS